MNISPWAYIQEGLYSNGFYVNKSLGLHSRGLIIEGAYTRDFTVYPLKNVELTLRDFHTFLNIFELIYQVNVVDLGSLCLFSKKTKMTSFIKERYGDAIQSGVSG